MDIGSTHPIYKCRCLTKLTQAGLNTSLALCFFQKLEKNIKRKLQRNGKWVVGLLKMPLSFSQNHEHSKYNYELIISAI